jgi:hypothetical protein
VGGIGAITLSIGLSVIAYVAGQGPATLGEHVAKSALALTFIGFAIVAYFASR